MAQTTVTTNPAFIEAAIRAKYPNVTDQAPVAAVLRYMAGLAGKGLSTDEIVSSTNGYRTQLEKGYKEGRDGWGGDVDDTARDLLRGAAIASGAAKGLAAYLAATGNVPAAAATLAVSEAAGVARDVGENALDLTPVQDWVKERRNLFSTYAMHGLVDEYNRSASSMIAAFHDQCLQDPACQQAAAVVFPDLATGQDRVDVRPGAVVNANPHLFPPVLQTSVRADLTVVIDVQELSSSLTEQFTSATTVLRTDLARVHGELVVLRTEQQKLVAWLDNTAAQEAARAREEQLRAQVQQRWENAQKSIEVAAVVAGIFDKKLGSDIRRVGGAGLAVVKSGMDLVKAASSLSKGVTAATALSSAAATGNFIGAALALVGAFAPTGPTPEQVILDEVKALRDDMRTLQQAMTERFDRIDRTLQTIYVDVMTKLDAIDVTLGQVNGKVDEILDDLDRMEAALMHHQQVLVDFFQAAHREPLHIAFLTALGRPDVAQAPTMSSVEFSEAEGLFRAWASIISGNDVEVPSTTWQLDDAHLGAQLRGSALEHVALVNAVAASRAWPSFASLAPSERLHNAHTWMLASGAYSELEREWPALAAAATSADHDARRAEVAAPGRRLLTALQQIPRRGAVDLLAKAIENLKSRYDEYGQALGSAEEAWQGSDMLMSVLAADPEQPSTPVWRVDPSAESGYVPRVGVWPAGAAGPEPTLEFPRAAVTQIPAIFRNASRLNDPSERHSLRVVVSFTEYRWSERIEVVRPGDGPWVMDENGVHQPPPDIVDVVVVQRTGRRYTADVVYRDQPVQRYALDARHGGDLAAVWTGSWAGRIARGEGRTDLRPDGRRAIEDVTAARARLWTMSFLPWLHDGHFGAAHDGLRVAAGSLDGALRLVECLLELGLPTARTNDEALRAVLDGEPVWSDGLGLFRPNQLLGHLMTLDAAGARSAPTQAMPTTVDDAIKEPMDLLVARVEAYQTALEQGTYVEHHRDIELTLQRLAVAGSIVDHARAATDRHVRTAERALPRIRSRVAL